MNKNNVIKGLGLTLGTFALCHVLGGLSLVGGEKTVVVPSSRVICPPEIATESLALAQAEDIQGRLVADAEDTLIIDMRDGLSRAEVDEKRAQWLEQFGLRTRYNSLYAEPNALLVSSLPQANISVNELLRLLNQDELVEAAEINWLVSLSKEEQAVAKEELSPVTAEQAVAKEELSPAAAEQTAAKASYPNDPLYKHQWHLDMIRAPFAWQFSQGRGAVVAVIDTGVAWRDGHNLKGSIPNPCVACEDLANTKIVRGYDFVNHNDWALDDNTHGTHVAGTIAQSTHNGVGVCGVAPQAAIMPIKVLSGSGTGRTADIVDGIRFAADHGANVINMSLGGPLPSQALENAVSYANSKGVLVVCAAGNEHRQSVGFPAGCQESFVVSALNAKGDLAWYSNYGKRVDIAAPGGDTRSDDNGDGVPDGVYQNTIKPGNPEEQGYFAFQGTSMATPHVAGAAAVLVGQGVNSPQALKRILSRSADKALLDKVAEGGGAGALDVGKAANRVNTWYGTCRLVLAVLLAVALGAFGSQRSSREKLAVVPGLVLGACGLFALPYMCSAAGWFSWLTLPLPAWDTFFLGAGVHGNLVMCSCLVPTVLSWWAMRCRAKRRLVAGLCLGWTAYMVVEMLTGATLLHLIPAWLSWLWWGANALFCLCLAQVNLGDMTE